MNKTLKQALSLVVIVTAVTLPGVVLGQWSAGLDNASKSGVPDAKVTDIIKNIMNWLLYILGFLGIIGFVISGIMYLVAAGDEKLIDRAKNGLTYSIIGIIVALLGFVIMRAVDALLRASSSTNI